MHSKAYKTNTSVISVYISAIVQVVLDAAIMRTVVIRLQSFLWYLMSHKLLPVTGPLLIVMIRFFIHILMALMQLFWG